MSVWGGPWISRRMRNGACLGSILTLLPMLPCPAALVPLIEPDARIERAADSLEHPRASRSAEQALLRLTRDRDETVRAAASAVLAAQYRRTDRLDQAAPLLEPWADLRPENLAPNRLEALLEYARGEAQGGLRLPHFARSTMPVNTPPAWPPL